MKRVPEATIPQVQRERCRVCPVCEARAACEHSAIVRLDPDEMPWVDASRCHGCRTCIAACPHGALVVGSTTGPV